MYTFAAIGASVGFSVKYGASGLRNPSPARRALSARPFRTRRAHPGRHRGLLHFARRLGRARHGADVIRLPGDLLFGFDRAEIRRPPRLRCRRPRPSSSSGSRARSPSKATPTRSGKPATMSSCPTGAPMPWRAGWRAGKSRNPPQSTPRAGARCGRSRQTRGRTVQTIRPDGRRTAAWKSGSSDEPVCRGRHLALFGTRALVAASPLSRGDRNP